MAEGELTAVQTSAGMGTRSRPINLYSVTSMIPKGLMRVTGIPIAEMQLEQFKAAGIKEVYIITQYLENREHLSNRFSDGTHRFDLKIHYSHPRDDKTNNGSGDAILTNIERNSLRGNSIWLANDNLYEFDIGNVVRTHIDSGAVVSIMTTKMSPRDTIKKYGLIDTDAHHKVKTLIEKPENERQITAYLQLSDPEKLGDMRVEVNTGGYILNNDLLSRISKEKWVVEGRKKESGNFDMAGSLIRGLVEKSYPVYTVPIDAWGDFGSISSFLDTFPNALSGLFPSIYTILRKRGYYENLSGNVWIHRESLYKKEKGKTLEERINSGDVKIGPNVFIGRESVIGDCAIIRYSNLEKYSKIGENASIDHSYLSSYCDIGPSALLRECALGLGVEVNSSETLPTHINGRSVIGPGVLVPAGTTLDKAMIFPGYNFEGTGRTYKGMELKPSDEQVLSIAKGYQ